MSEDRYLADNPESAFFECPRFVWIGGVKFEIQVMDQSAAELGGVLGAANPDRGSILLADIENRQVLGNTAIHEVIHCINRDRNIPGQGDEEYITDQMASGLCDFWIRNPEFFKWWGSMLNG